MSENHGMPRQPELRFTQDDGTAYPDWEETTLGEKVNFFRGKNLGKKHLTEDGTKPAILYGQLFTLYSERITDVVSRTNGTGEKGRVGDVLMPTSDVTADGLAKACCLLVDGVEIGGDVNILRPSDTDGVFLAYLLSFQKQKIVDRVTGTTVKHIYIKNISNLDYSFPSPPEQKKIGEMLGTIDDKIASLKARAG